jgi:hypothetical protein
MKDLYAKKITNNVYEITVTSRHQTLCNVTTIACIAEEQRPHKDAKTQEMREKIMAITQGKR